MTLTGGSGGFESPWTAAGERRIRADAQLLRTALRKAVSTSPEAFFTTLADLKARSDAGWEREIRTSSWAVLETGDTVVGIAAAKPPDPVADSGHDPALTCFIESVWVDPDHRRQGLGERLVRYLIETQRGRGIEWFLLWVLPANLGAISFYESLGFRKTGELKPYARDEQGSWGLEVQFGAQFASRDAADDGRASRPAPPRRGTPGPPVGCRLLGAGLEAGA